MTSSHLESLNWRYATKKFNPTAHLTDEQWQAIEDTLRLCPSSLGIQPWRFIVVDSTELRQQLRDASFGQSQVTDASHYVVLCGRRELNDDDLSRFVDSKKEILGLSDEQAEQALTRYKGFSIFWDSPEKLKSYIESQIHLAAGFVSHAVAQWRIDSCMIGGMMPEQYDAILGLDGTPYRAVLGIAFGHRHEEDSHAQDPKVRYSADEVIEHR